MVIRYVDAASGNDSNDGSIGSPKLTLQAGLDSLSSGDVLNVSGSHAVTTSLNESVGKIGIQAAAGASIDCSGVVMFGTTSGVVHFRGFSLSGDVDGWLNTHVDSTVSACVMSGSRVNHAYRILHYVGCDIQANVENMYGSLSNCKLSGTTFTSGNANEISVSLCRFDGVDVQFNTRSHVGFCSFSNCVDVDFARPDLVEISNCVFRHGTPGQEYPNHTSGFATSFSGIENCYGYNVSIPANISSLVDFTALSVDPYPSVNVDDWTPSAELIGKAEDGLMPGAIQASGGSTSPSSAVTLLQPSSIPGA